MKIWRSIFWLSVVACVASCTAFKTYQISQCRIQAVSKGLIADDALRLCR